MNKRSLPPWLIPLLSNKQNEFHHIGEQEIHICGKFDKEWIIDVKVTFTPHFAWGANNYRTGMTGSFKDVVRYQLMVIMNQLSEKSFDCRELLKLIKGL